LIFIDSHKTIVNLTLGNLIAHYLYLETTSILFAENIQKRTLHH